MKPADLLSKRNFTRAALVLVPVVSVLIIARTLIRQSPGPIREDFEKASRVATYPGKKPPDPTLISGNGVVEPRLPETRLAMDTPGRIAAIYVKEGDQVDKGAILAELDNTMARAQVARAEAEVAAADAELLRARHGMREQDVNAIAADAIAAKARSALAASDLARTQELSSKGSISQAELEQAKRRYEAEQAISSAAAQRASGAREGSRKEDLMIAESRLKAATAGLEEARGAFQKTQVLAPIMGQILRVKLHVGEFHNPMSGDPVIIMGDMTRLRVRVDVDERDIAKLKVGASAHVAAPAFGDQRFPGKVVEIGRRMGRRTVRVDDPTDRIDVKILETVIELDGSPQMVSGMRVTGFIKI